ncbi:MAG: type IV toxin-antitoxin system AbiEi family antitoxin domain-containing protein [Nocardioides sp.]
MDRSTPRPALAAVAHGQFGLFTRGDALAAGYSSAEIRARVGPRGAWRVVRRGVYIPARQWDDAISDDQWWWRDVAAHLQMTAEHVLSHDSAARGHGLPLLRQSVPLLHVTRPGVGGSRTRHGVKHHLGRERPAVVVRRGGIGLTGLARTALDLAREHGFSAGVVALDAALRREATVRDVEMELARMTSWPFVMTARRAFAFADPAAESVGESLTRILLAELGLGPIETQFPVPVGDGVRWCDLRVGRHVFEFDGLVKYRSPADGGVASIDPAEVAFRDRRRDTEIGEHGLGISHVVWEDLFAGRERAAAPAPTRGSADSTTLRHRPARAPGALRA